MKSRILLLILAVGLVVVGGSFWYARNRAGAPLGDTAGKVLSSVQSPVVSSATGTLDIPALEKELGIEIKEIDPPTSDVDTSDWKTYRNEEYGFEVRYPGG